MMRLCLHNWTHITSAAVSLLVLVLPCHPSVLWVPTGKKTLLLCTKLDLCELSTAAAAVTTYFSCVSCAG